MPRKFDRRGWNRQFKWHPCSRRHPYPYHLPFVDDFSPAATAHAQQTGKIPRRALGPPVHPQDQPSPEQQRALKRAYSQMMSRAHKKQKLFQHYPQHKKTRAEKVSDAIFGTALGLTAAGGAWLGAAAYLEGQGGAGYMARQMAQFAARHHLD